MNIDFASLNWLAVLVSIVVGQAFLTVWFFVLFGEPWARAYGAASKQEHTSQVPGYTYGIGVACMALLTIGLAVSQRAFGVAGIADGIVFGLVFAVCFAVATALPGYAFLKRWQAGVLAIGSQSVLILVLSLILALWQ
ncbi:DUF1761 domain-containing protein [Cucumibacter marinus]|uniref:DUF1761 domain-containing protein n=1 Tax=Cucumibacter marinus TaxID=1121252 RepID=UPI000429904A|nr:DUF1761 domain-containing protein [Cucumibacter marinus]